MKKINLLAVVVAGAFAAACNGGGSSNNSGSGGGSTSDACANGAATCGAPAAPVAYNQPIQSGGSLLSTTGLYVSTGSTDVPLPFEVNNITQETVVTFTIAQSSASTSTNKLQASVLPVLSSNSCTFNAASPQVCNLTVNFTGASNGTYNITPSVAGQAMVPVTITSMNGSSFTLPDGTYTTTEYGAGSDCVPIPISHQMVVNNNQICFANTTDCQPNAPFPTPNGPNPFAGHGYMDYVSYNGTTASLNWTPPANCPMQIAITTITWTGPVTTSVAQVSQKSPIGYKSFFGNN